MFFFFFFFFNSFRSLHMQQHPDYKYRPRRKPKPLVKSPTSNGHSNHNGNSTNNTSSYHNHHHSSNSSGSSTTNNNNSNSNNNNNDSRSSNNNLHHHHHHSLKSTSPSIIANHLHPHHHTSSKYSFVPTIELPISFPPTQHSQQQAVFPSGIHYPLVDPTLALDLQARLHAMYMNAYYPWRLPLISSTSSPPLSSTHYASSPKISPTTTTNSPPPPPIDKNSHSPDTQSTII